VSSLHFNLNRPIHLARRNAFFERAAELLNIPILGLDLRTRLRLVDTILSLLQAAERHAFFAARSVDTSERERDFQRVLHLITDNAQSIDTMWQQQAHLVEEESSLCRFLGASPEQCVLPAMHYQRRAEDIHQGLWHVLQLVHVPYRQMHEAIREAMSAEERERYDRAYASFRQEVLTRFPVPAPGA